MARERDRKPTPTARPTRTPVPPTAPPSFSTGGIGIFCEAIDKGGPATKDNLIRVTLVIENNSGAELRGLTAHALDISGGPYRINSSSGVTRTLGNRKVATFRYSIDSDAALRINASASATAPNGSLVRLGPVSCAF